MGTKGKSLSATMNELVEIVSSNWQIPEDNLNEVYPGIFIGDEIAAKDIGVLKEMKITHILNAAYSERKSFLYVDTSQTYYSERKFECTFMGLSAVDCFTYKVAKYFQQASDFIDVAVNFPQGKILVHCRQGVSRSATFVIAYLMLKKGMTGREAVTLVRKKRSIFPNKGFLKEICDLEQTLPKSKNNGNANCVNTEDNKGDTVLECNMLTKGKSLSATMNDLVAIVSLNWQIPEENLNEVYPGIFVGDEIAAKDIGVLKEMQITHILNAAYSERKSFVYVDTSQTYYSERKFECTFMGLSAVDCFTYKLAKYFQQASDFIDVAVNFPQGKILVHCRQGVSRSATFVIVYLMLKKGMTGREAITLVRNKRNIFPNKGFLKEICDLEQTLSKFKINGNKICGNTEDKNAKDGDIVSDKNRHNNFKTSTDVKKPTKT